MSRVCGTLTTMLAHPVLGRVAPIAVAGGLLLGADIAPAQEPSSATEGARVSIGLGGGASRGSSLGRGPTIGYHAVASLEARTPLPVLRLRTDATFADWGADRMTAFGAAVVLAPVRARKLTPYLLAGGGGYVTPGDRMTAGWTLGGGLQVPIGDRTILLESRMHAFRNADHGSPDLADRFPQPAKYRYVALPIGVGLRF